MCKPFQFLPLLALYIVFSLIHSGQAVGWLNDVIADSTSYLAEIQKALALDLSPACKADLTIFGNALYANSLTGIPVHMWAFTSKY